MPPRLFVDTPLQGHTPLVELPPSAARHAQVLRLQPGDPVVVFNGQGGQWSAHVAHMGRRDVQVQLSVHDTADCELPAAVTLAVGMPANDRFDWLVEKATELGADRLQPLVCERSVLRVAGERADRKREHWQGVAIAAAEQCGRTRVPDVAMPRPFGDWLNELPVHDPSGSGRWLLRPGAVEAWRAPTVSQAHRPQHLFLSGPEGGLTPQEEAKALAAGFDAVHLGPRTLRAETAPLVVLVTLGG